MLKLLFIFGEGAEVILIVALLLSLDQLLLLVSYMPLYLVYLSTTSICYAMATSRQNAGTCAQKLFQTWEL